MDVFVSGSLAFIAGGGYGLYIIDVSNPANPVLLADYGRTAHRVFVSDSLAYVANGLDGMEIIDVSDPANPVQLCDYDTIGCRRRLRLRLHGLRRRDRIACEIIDVSNPASPVRRGGYEHDLPGGHVVVSGSVAYVVAYVVGSLRQMHIFRVGAAGPVAVTVSGTGGDDQIYVRDDAGTLKWWIAPGAGPVPNPAADPPTGTKALSEVGTLTVQGGGWQ